MKTAIAEVLPGNLNISSSRAGDMIIRISSRAIMIFLVAGLWACGGGGESSGGSQTAPALAELTINNPSISEGDSGTNELIFSVNLDKTDSADVSVDFATADGGAIAGSDYTSINGRLTILAGSTSATIIVTVMGDFDVETDDSLSLNLSNISTNATLGVQKATGTIINDDFPSVTIATATALEGNIGTTDLLFTVSMNVSAIGDVTVDYASNNLSASAGEDYTLTTGTLTITEGDISATVSVPVTGDIFLETDETLTLGLTNLSDNARFGTDNAIGTILNDDFPFLSIDSASLTEGDTDLSTLLFIVSLEQVALGAVNFDYTTSDNSAVQPGDYIASSGTLTINEGDTVATLAVDIVGDSVAESSENFFLTLSNVTGNATLNPAATVGVGSISDNDAAAPTDPIVIVSLASAVEGNTPDTVNMLFNVSVSPTDSAAISFDYATDDVAGQAVAATDYTATSGTLIIPANTDNATILVNVTGDNVIESDEFFNLLLSNISSNASLHAPQVTGLIVDDDDSSQTQPRLNISNATVFEGDSGSRDMQFVVSLSEAAATDISVDYQFEDINAVNGSDFIGTNGSITIAAGDTSALINVQALGDTLVEADETFRVSLSQVTGDATLTDAEGIGTIFTDDPFAKISTIDAGVQEGDDGPVDLIFTINLDVSTDDDVTVDYTTSNIDAIGGDDYVAAAGTLIFAAGETEISLTITVNGDEDLEGDEQFNLILSNASSNAIINTSTVTGSIINDDGSGWGEASIQEEIAGGVFRDISKPTIAIGANGDAMVTAAISLADEIISKRYSSSGGWEATIPVDSHRSRAAIPVTVDASGNATIVWHKFNVSANHYDVSISNWTGTTEVQAAFIDNGVLGLSNPATDFKIAGNANGDAIAVWREQAHANGSAVDNIWSARYTTAGGWEAPAIIENNTTTNAVSADVAMDAAGNAIVVWLEFDAATQNFDVISSRFDVINPVWSTPVSIENLAGASGPPRVAMNAGGDAISVWLQGGTVMANRYNPTTDNWLAAPELVQQGVDNALKPEVTIDDAGNAIVAWVTQNATTQDASANRFDASANSWDIADESLESTNGSVQIFDGLIQIGVKVAGDGLGNAIVIWAQDDDTGNFVNDIRVNRYSITDGWGGPVTIDSGDESATNPDIALDKDGNAIAVWAQPTIINTTRDSLWSNRYIAP